MRRSAKIVIASQKNRRYVTEFCLSYVNCLIFHDI